MSLQHILFGYVVVSIFFSMIWIRKKREKFYLVQNWNDKHILEVYNTTITQYCISRDLSLNKFFLVHQKFTYFKTKVAIVAPTIVRSKLIQLAWPHPHFFLKRSITHVKVADKVCWCLHRQKLQWFCITHKVNIIKPSFTIHFVPSSFTAKLGEIYICMRNLSTWCQIKGRARPSHHLKQPPCKLINNN